MEAVWTRIANEAALIVLLMGVAIVFLWRELVKERAAHLQTLKETVAEKKAMSELYAQFQMVLKGNADALEDNTQELTKLKDNILSGGRRGQG